MSGLPRLLCSVVLAAALVSGVAVAADSTDITFDRSADFRALKTFAIGQGRISSYKPEIDNRLFRQRMEASIRAALVKKGLTEVTESPDFTITYSVEDRDVSAVERPGPTRIPGDGSGQGMPVRGPGPTPKLSTEGSLVIDINSKVSALLWRGTVRNVEASGPRLSRKLSEDASKVLSKFPAKR